jgi:hypothetical protein
MTNLEIQQVATQLAEHYAARAEYLDPEDAWYRWSAESRLTSPGARYLFERMYQARMARLVRTLKQA